VLKPVPFKQDRLAHRLAHRQLENGEIGLHRSQEGAGVDRETADSGEAFLGLQASSHATRSLIC